MGVRLAVTRIYGRLDQAPRLGDGVLACSGCEFGGVSPFVV